MDEDPVVLELRERIADNDRAIIESLNRRIALVAELRSHKIAHGYELVDPGRERWLVEHLAASNGGPLSPEGLREFIIGVLELTKREIAG
jgi:chorismate mutase